GVSPRVKPRPISRNAGCGNSGPGGRRMGCAIDLLVKSRIALGLRHCWWVGEEFFTQLFVLSRFQLSGEGVYGLEGFWVVVPCIFVFTTPLLHALSVFEEGHEVGPPHANGSRSSGWRKVL